MRFDDRLATVLAQPAADASARGAAWRQLVDLLAQMRADDGSPVVAEAYARLRDWRDDAPAEMRLAVARTIAGRRLPVDLVRAFAADTPSVAAPVIGAVRLSDDEWFALIPTLPPAARGLLRHRRDFGPEIERALALHGAADFVLDAPPAPAPATAAESAPAPATAAESAPEPQPQIADLVARIEAFRRDRQLPPLPPFAHDAQPPVEAFAFETDWDGTILWVDIDERAPLIGLSLAASAESFGQGFDGQAAGAFRDRAAFRDARLLVAGEGGAGGEWRVSGVPFFDDRSGRFLGYRGKARRPRFAERAEPAAAGLYGSDVTPESLRSLVHELRTPLNAIIGFAEMIDRQILGPASSEYRYRAGTILAEARRLADAVDDLDTAARIETRSLRIEPDAIDAAALVARLQRQLGASQLRVTIADGLAPVAADRASAERMFARLVAAALGAAGEGEVITARLEPAGQPDRVAFAVDRPAALHGRDEAALLDPGYSPDGDWPEAPLLGLGFSLRLVRNLAEASGARLTIGDERFVLLLPAAAGAPIEENLVQS